MVASRFQSFCCLFASGFLVASGFESLCCPVAVGRLVASGLKGFACLVASSSWVQLVLRGFLYSGLLVANGFKDFVCLVVAGFLDASGFKGAVCLAASGFLDAIGFKLFYLWLLRDLWLQVVLRVFAVCLPPEFLVRAVSKLCGVRLFRDFWLQVVSKDVWLLRVFGCNSFSEFAFIRIAGCKWLQSLYMYGFAGVFGGSMTLAVMFLGACRNVCFNMFMAVY